MREFLPMPCFRVSLCFVMSVLVAGCDKPPRAVPSTQPAEAHPEPWATLPPAQWPQMVLTNKADFRGHTSLEGASAFLIRSADGRILAATALHLLGENGGVEPRVPAEQLPNVLASWRIFPRTKPHPAATITGLGYKTPPHKNLDWLILTVKDEAGTWPAFPLTLRPKAVAVGDEVFLVGVPYAEPDRMQNVYRGKVTARGFGDRFRYSIDPPVDIRGFSGAPILDPDGLVVGVMTVWFEPKMQGEKYLEAGGEDAAAVLETITTPR